MPRVNKLKMAVDGVGLLSRAIVGLKSAEVLVQSQAGGQKKKKPLAHMVSLIVSNKTWTVWRWDKKNSSGEAGRVGAPN